MRLRPTLLCVVAAATAAFAPIARPPLHRRSVARQGFADFFKELDLVVDDAMNKRLGGGSTFYGARKSSFSKTKDSYASIEQKGAAEREEERAMDYSFAKRTFALPTIFAGPGSLSGKELRSLVLNKWGERYPVLIKRKRDALGKQRMYLVVSWKRLGKANLDLSESEYVAESDAVAELLSEWGVAATVRREIKDSTAYPKLMTKQFPGLFIGLDVAERVVETW